MLSGLIKKKWIVNYWIISIPYKKTSLGCNCFCFIYRFMYVKLCVKMSMWYLIIYHVTYYSLSEVIYIALYIYMRRLFHGQRVSHCINKEYSLGKIRLFLEFDLYYIHTTRFCTFLWLPLHCILGSSSLVKCDSPMMSFNISSCGKKWK